MKVKQIKSAPIYIGFPINYSFDFMDFDYLEYPYKPSKNDEMSRYCSDEIDKFWAEYGIKPIHGRDICVCDMYPEPGTHTHLNERFRAETDNDGKLTVYKMDFNGEYQVVEPDENRYLEMKKQENEALERLNEYERGKYSRDCEDIGQFLSGFIFIAFIVLVALIIINLF